MQCHNLLIKNIVLFIEIILLLEQAKVAVWIASAAASGLNN